ncbi:hypothetical protein SHKM778_25480 [Streptomyces sp. KM77-8]|uniref:Uncharacterized protein n=1 Tax=Streptomyces haneummycinicus TaxID=3074435 RepID=A0AAT9HFF1_9ACTN
MITRSSRRTSAAPGARLADAPVDTMSEPLLYSLAGTFETRMLAAPADRTLTTGWARDGPPGLQGRGQRGVSDVSVRPASLRLPFNSPVRPGRALSTCLSPAPRPGTYREGS